MHGSHIYLSEHWRERERGIPWAGSTSKAPVLDHETDSNWAMNRSLNTIELFDGKIGPSERTTIKKENKLFGKNSALRLRVRTARPVMVRS